MWNEILALASLLEDRSVYHKSDTKMEQLLCLIRGKRKEAASIDELKLFTFFTWSPWVRAEETHFTLCFCFSVSLFLPFSSRRGVCHEGVVCVLCSFAASVREVILNCYMEKRIVENTNTLRENGRESYRWPSSTWDYKVTSLKHWQTTQNYTEQRFWKRKRTLVEEGRKVTRYK